MVGNLSRAQVRLAGALSALILVVWAIVAAANAHALPPQNDYPGGAAPFTPVTAENGEVRDQQAIGELAEASPDPGTLQCLGPDSFARTVWFRVPAAETPQEVTVEASGRTLLVVDLAAFVQPEGRDPANPLVTEPNACDGRGAGGSDASEEPTSAVTLQVPARREVLIQAGRRGAVRSPDDERVLLSLDARPLAPLAPPRGDFGSLTTAPRARALGPSFVDLAGATITEEDPVQPPCPSLGSVWRRFVPSKTVPRLISVSGGAVSTLTVFAGGRPLGSHALDCVNREGPGSLQMVVPGRKNRTLWIRVGTDGASPGSEATVRVTQAPGAAVIDGGAGGFDPTPYGPAGGFPSSCAKSVPSRARVTGPSFGGKAKLLNRRTSLALRVRVRTSTICDVSYELVGPRKRVYGRARAVAQKGRRTVTLKRTRRFVRGGYRLRVTAISELGERVGVRTALRGRLSK